MPWVKSVSEANLLDNTASPNGTFVLDRSDKYVKAKINNTWQNLNYLANNTNIIPVNTIDANKTERVEAQVIIGSPNSSAKGILVLESIAKAMVLPKFRNVHKSIVNPAPGMVVLMIPQVKSKYVFTMVQNGVFGLGNKILVLKLKDYIYRGL